MTRKDYDRVNRAPLWLVADMETWRRSRPNRIRRFVRACVELSRCNDYAYATGFAVFGVFGLFIVVSANG